MPIKIQTTLTQLSLINLTQTEALPSSCRIHIKTSKIEDNIDKIHPIQEALKALARLCIKPHFPRSLNRLSNTSYQTFLHSAVEPKNMEAESWEHSWAQLHSTLLILKLLLLLLHNKLLFLPQTSGHGVMKLHAHISCLTANHQSLLLECYHLARKAHFLILSMQVPNTQLR